MPVQTSKVVAGSIAAVVSSATKGKGNLSRIEPGSSEMEMLLSVGYPGMSRAKAETIIRERKENPALWPYSKLEEAEAYLAALHASPVAIDTEPGFNQPGSAFLRSPADEED